MISACASVFQFFLLNWGASDGFQDTIILTIILTAFCYLYTIYMFHWEHQNYFDDVEKMLGEEIDDEYQDKDVGSDVEFKSEQDLLDAIKISTPKPHKSKNMKVPTVAHYKRRLSAQNFRAGIGCAPER